MSIAPISKPLNLTGDVFSESLKSEEQDEIETTDTFSALQSSPPFNSLIIPALEFASQNSSPLVPPQPTQTTKSESASAPVNQGQAVAQPVRSSATAATSSTLNMNLPIGSNLSSTLASQQSSQSAQSSSSNSNFLPQNLQQQPRFGSNQSYPDLFGYSNIGSQSSLLNQRNILVNQSQFSANSNLINQQPRANINIRPAQPTQQTQSFQQFPQQPQSQIHHQIEQQLNSFMPGTYFFSYYIF